MLIFVLQTIWLYITELAGKDLDIVVIMKFLVYFMPKLIPLVLPLTILLSSIMVFGSFAENYEFAAMKSTGISLQRAMAGLSIFIIGIGITTFFFANNIIPWAEINSYNLRKNIAKLKPAAFIAEGQFNQLDDGFNIKVDKKSGDSDQYLEKVVIHKRVGNSVGKHSTIISETGEFFYKKESEVLQLILYNGNYYEDLLPRDLKSRNKKPFAKSTFEKYIINIDLSQLNNVDMDEKSQTDRYSMLDIPGLDKAIDSLIEYRQKEHEGISKNLLVRSGISRYGKKADLDKINKDSIYKGNILDFFDTKKKSEFVDLASKSIVSAQQVMIQKMPRFKNDKITFNRHVISFHEKFALGFACIILFFVGAPLGALIRKGGIGLPMVVAILLFLTYHFIGIFATNSAKNGEFSPVLASWFSTLVMLPLGIYLTKRATADRGLFEVGNILEPLKKVFNIKLTDSVDYKFLSSYSEDELLNVIRNYKALGHEEPIRYEALTILNQKGKSISDIRDSGIPINGAYDKSKKTVKKYINYSKSAIILYSIGAVLLILFFVLKNNKLPSVGSVSLKLSLGLFILYIVYYVKSLLKLFSFYKNLIKPLKKPNSVLLIIGLPLYFIAYPFLNVKIKEDKKQNCLDSLK
jgi:lipopolysaccharide export system permease protein